MMENTANIGKRSKAWLTWRKGNYYDDAEFIKETQGQPRDAHACYDDDDYQRGHDCDLSGIPPELWPEIDRKGGDKVDSATNLLNSRTPESKWPTYTPSTTTSYAYEKCHEGNILVFKHENISVYGGGSSRGLQIWEDSFMIDMGDQVDEKYVEFAGCYYPELFTLKLIKVACKDYNVPNIGATFWSRLVDILKRESADKPIKVICCCMGGHGRTGMALSILASLLEVVPADACPVTWVREHYCKNAVEAYKQLKYIEEVTGRKVEAKEPKDKWSATTPSKGGEAIGFRSYGMY
jgi:protein-tyrosine phosphatase